MGNLEKKIQKLLSLPKNYTYEDARSLLESLGFKEVNKGKTSGSRVGFKREVDQRMIVLHKPHGKSGKVMDIGATKDLAKYIEELWKEEKENE